MANLRLPPPLEHDRLEPGGFSGRLATFGIHRQFAAIVCVLDGSTPQCSGCIVRAVAEWSAR